jgi:3-hydroxybutyryl-CoA dehydrogenase
MTRIDVIGTGLMGKGISHCFGVSGYTVYLWGRKSREELNADFQLYIAKIAGKKNISDDEIEKLQNNICLKSLKEDMDFLNDSEYLFESISENLQVKNELFSMISRHCNKNTVIATNTSSIPLNELVKHVTNKENFIGVHFFSPVHINELVEVSKTQYVSDILADTMMELLRSINKKVYLVPNIPGYLFNRILFSQLSEALHLVETYNVPIESIDEIIKIGSNVKCGPFQLMDLIGLDVILDCFSNIYMYEKESKYKPSSLLIEYVRNGHLGKKSGSGFYKY